MDNYQLKKELCNIVDKAYSNDPKLEKYKEFSIDILNVERKTFLGHYNRKTKVIQINNLGSQTTASIIVTSIHEVTHHIDFVQRGTSGHDQQFYIVYKPLLYAALDLGYFTVDDYRKQRFSQEFNKVIKLIDAYIPEQTSNNSDTKRIDVYNSFNIKDILKTHGYKYDSRVKVWSKEINEKALTAEQEFLNKLNAEFKIMGVKDFVFLSQKEEEIKGKTKILVKNSYDIKERLKERGYKWDKKNKGWYIYTDFPNEEYETVQNMSSSVKIICKR